MRLLLEVGELRRRRGTATWYAPGYEPRHATETGVMRRLAAKGLLVIVGDAAVLPP